MFLFKVNLSTAWTLINKDEEYWIPLKESAKKDFCPVSIDGIWRYRYNHELHKL